MDINKEEKKVLDFWQENEIFKKSVEKEASRGKYVFYDGPPFITGLPHYATLLPSIAKDVIPRYQTMKGYRVDRVWGWDCHGIPAENRVEKNLGLKNKKDVEDLGVDKFVGACREYVGTCSEQWKWYVDRIGRWVDMDNAYKTMDLKFMESVIWSFKELYQKGLIYEGYRTSLHCPRCATPLSKFEVTMDAGSYKDIEEDSLVVKFKINENQSFSKLNLKNVYALAWTTTPWTLPGNLALAVGGNIDYIIVKKLEENYIIAKEKLGDFFENKNEIKIVKELKGKDLVNLEYQPVFDLKNEEIKENQKVFKIYSADFVGTEEGTGIVHIAPNFGEDDFELGKRERLPMINLMDENGIYTNNSGEWNGYYFEKANEKVLNELGDNIFLNKKHTHSYPFCYRCDTKLIHKTQKAWYLSIEKIREKMIKSNKEINWVPSHFKEGRFKYNLESAPDWCLSRSRYWGSPVPVWKCKCGNIKVVGSIKELEELSKEKIKELHRPEIDRITFECEKCGGEMKRVLEVLDCWFESGSMPFAQFHYPFERKEEWNELFPADFIIEYTGQLRGWFYYLHVLSNALFESIAFKNVIVTGVLMGNDGRKMSKSFGNYPDPKMVLEKYGSDALRIYFMSNSIMTGGDMNMSESDIQDFFRKNIIILSNVVNFYELFSSKVSHLDNDKEPEVSHILDKWILSRLNETIKNVTEGLENYNLPLACHPIPSFINDLSTWYIRRSRARFKGGDNNDSKKALETTNYVLFQFSKIIAPIMPFISENIWQKLSNNNFKNDNESVHLTQWPKGGKIDQDIIDKMSNVRKIVELGLAKRDEKKVKIRQPLLKAEIKNCELSLEYIELIKDELNVKDIEVIKGKGDIEVNLDFNITEELKIEGLKREMVRLVNDLRKKKGLGIGDTINLYYKTESSDIEKVISDGKLKKELVKETLSKEIKKSQEASKDYKEAQVNGNKIFIKIEVI